MDFDVERERAVSDADMRHLLAEPAAETIRQVIEAYKRDLPQLMVERQERKVVAYLGSERLGIATTRELLLAGLKESGILETNTGLYIKNIRCADEDHELFYSDDAGELG